MRHIHLVLLFIFTLFAQSAFAQFLNIANNAVVVNTDTITDAYRSARLGIGFNRLPGINNNNFKTALGTSPKARFAVKGGILAHYVSGEIGDFNAAKWCGLGVGNPGAPLGVPTPYGLAIAENGSVGFYNLLANSNNILDLIAGFGSVENNKSRFIIRSYENSAVFNTGKDLLIANPRGTVSILREPSQAGPDLSTTFWVDATRSDAAFKNITVFNGAPLNNTTFPNPVNTFSALGRDGNSSSAEPVLIEGFRAQIDGLAPPFAGNAVNLQAIRNADPANAIDALFPGEEASELTWQDLNSGNLNLAQNFLANPPAAGLDKMYFSFRNANNVGNFAAANRLRVMTMTANGRVGIGTTNPISFSGFALGPVLLTVAGNVVANGAVLTSDRRFKDNIRPVEDALGKIRQLQGSTYTFRTKEFEDYHFGEGTQYGFIAQDVEKVIPDIVAKFDNGYYGINYTSLIPVLTEAIKEQDQIITAQKTEMEDMKNEIAELRSQFNDLKTGQSANNLDGFRLEQNSPNPFGQNTVIAYAVPTGTTGARINVYDLTGRTIKSFNLSDAAGLITISAGELNNGLYIYDLQVNGRQMLERKMSVAKD